MITAIIAAAGSGQRFGSKIPKQFLDLAGRPVVRHAIDRFLAAPSIDAVVVVVARERMDEFEEDRARSSGKLIRVVEGGASRAGSVLNGLAAVPAETQIVAVHDGARPLVTADEIERTLAAARASGAACLVAPVTDTIKALNGDLIDRTLDRTSLRRALTPQAFRLELLRRAYEQAGDDFFSATDECSLVERLGHPITPVDGSSRNIKITTADDLLIAECLLRAGDEKGAGDGL